MIKTVVAISLLRLWNNKHELLLIFLVPILFLSIFALIFSRGVSQAKKQIQISFISDDLGESAERIIRRVVERPEIKPVTRVGQTTPQWPIMHTVFQGVSRDQMMARHKSNHIQVVYCPSARQAHRAARIKAAALAELGLAVSLCGDVRFT